MMRVLSDMELLPFMCPGCVAYLRFLDLSFLQTAALQPVPAQLCISG